MSIMPWRGCPICGAPSKMMCGCPPARVIPVTEPAQPSSTAATGETPRTDANVVHGVQLATDWLNQEAVHADFARQLERELAAMTLLVEAADRTANTALARSARVRTIACHSLSTPPIDTEPDGGWYCGGCGASDKEPHCKYRKSMQGETPQVNHLVATIHHADKDELLAQMSDLARQLEKRGNLLAASLNVVNHELREANDAASRWWSAALPHATPEALREFLKAPRTERGESADTKRLNWLQTTVEYTANGGPSHEANAFLDNHGWLDTALIESEGDLRKAIDAVMAQRAEEGRSK